MRKVENLLRGGRLAQDSSTKTRPISREKGSQARFYRCGGSKQVKMTKGIKKKKLPEGDRNAF